MTFKLPKIELLREMIHGALRAPYRATSDS